MKKYSDEQKAEAFELFTEALLSVAEIAEAIQVNKSTVYIWRKEFLAKPAHLQCLRH